jgi:phage/conjugal plasmid C-4 type zinc finger TraR family protein
VADDIDLANDIMQERLDQALAQRRAKKQAFPAHSFLYCENCDDPIPTARRLAIAGCTQCVSCQSIAESREARHAR